MTERQGGWPPDADARRQALDPDCSCIVQAPAGSGKTELLIQRILTLLARCEQPEEVLAITFTRKAAGEMKARLLDALAATESGSEPDSAHARLTWRLARDVVERDRQCSWGLFDNPARLQIMTIDSLCARLVKRMPWLSRFGSTPQIADDPSQLYRIAVESLLQQLENDLGPEGDALEILLNHLENRVPRLRDLLIDMLGRRDQWLRHVLMTDRTGRRHELEQNLATYLQERIELFKSILGDELLNELIELAAFAARQQAGQGDAALLQLLEDRSSVTFWGALSGLVHTASGTIRKNVDKRLGFPPDQDEECVVMKQRMLTLLEQLRNDPVAADAFSLLQALPVAVYSDPQWQILDALLMILPLAVVSLSTVFATQGQVDFVELAGAARRALGDTDQPEDLLLQFDSRVRHILVDEFQDTSHGQYHLLNQLTSGWTPDDGRTLFVVGDPMQSIYRFREAEVGLYLQARVHGLPSVQLLPLHLSANFRSQGAIVDWINTICPPLFPLCEDAARGAVTYAPAVATQPEASGPAVEVICFDNRQDQQEAAAVVATIQSLQQQAEIKTTAILVRSRTHLQQIVPALKSAGIRYQAQEIDPLMSRPVVRDLFALTRALLHLGDRIAWLAILRAPWCGLQADDLLDLCADGGKKTIWHQMTVNNSQRDLFGLSPEGAERLQKFIPVMKNSLRKRGSVSLSRLVESCWLSLGGPACVSAAELDDACQVFKLLEQLDDGGDLPDFELFESRLEKLYASPDPEATEALQVMTIHKAKGLEFDAVILPGLGRQIRGEDKTLLRWIDHPEHGLLLAPIPASDQGDAGVTYQAIGAINQDRSTLETLRMFYVAVTRARTRLFLYGHILKKKEGTEVQPPSGSLLQSIWPALDPQQIDVRDADNSAADAFPDPVVTLKRLPLSWNFPQFQSGGASPPEVVVRASNQSETQLSLSSLVSGYGRSVGTVVHEWLQAIAEEGLETWSTARLETEKRSIENRLNALGVAHKSLETMSSRVLNCLVNSINSKTGKWLLAAYADHACELALNGVVDGQMVHAIIDRTFVDAAGIRWVVDYKTSSRPENMPLEAFVAHETAHYRPQLTLYAALLRALEPHREVRCGLYFPLVDCFEVVELAD